MNCNEQGIMQNLGLTEKIFDSRKMNRKNVMQTVEWKKHWKEVTGWDEEKLFDVNWDQRKWETPASAQDMKLYSYPPRTIRNMSVPGFLTWLVLLLASIGGLLYTAWMTVTGDYEDGKVNTILGVVSFVVLICCLIYKTNYKRKLITYTDVLHAGVDW